MTATQVYELVINRPLFRYQINRKWGLTEVENMFYQMQLFTGADFEPAQLSASSRAGDYFASNCASLPPFLALLHTSYLLCRPPEEESPVAQIFLRVIDRTAAGRPTQ